MKRAKFLVTSVLMLVLAACSRSNTNQSSAATEDSSSSGAAASIVGGAIANSLSNGSVSVLSSVPLAAGTCPTLLTANGSGCSASGNSAVITYSSCSFGASAATWQGTMAVSLASSTAVTCGSFPSLTSDSLRRQFVASAGGAASSATRTSASGVVITVDDTTAGITANYEGDAFNGSGASGYVGTFFNSGGGKTVRFTNGKRDLVSILEHLSTSTWDHTVAGDVSLAESGSGLATTWTASSGTVTSGTCSGGLTVYHNRAKIMGQTCLENVTYNMSCCTPVSGTIVTTFSKTSASPTNILTSAMNGRTETLTITGCGTANHTDYSGTTTAVALSHCF